MKVVLQRKSIDLVIVKLQDLLYQYSRPKIPKSKAMNWNSRNLMNFTWWQIWIVDNHVKEHPIETVEVFF